MKIKLLKKIRKEYSIIHYPPGHYECRYNEYNKEGLYYLKHKGGWMSMREGWFHTKEDALLRILEFTRNDYREYSVKYWKNNKNVKKVWW